jgi:G3E family GTPase
VTLTHVLTGFLGVGKTTTLEHLIKQKPNNEKWAVLLNEFGETGLDALMLAGPDVVIKQVPGGCLCCVTQVPFQVMLNQLIRFDNPDRIFIEPSGLGHPDEIVKILKQDQYKKLLDVQPVITLIDPRHLNNPRHRGHEIYTRQLAVADFFVANKMDLASDQDRQAFSDLLAEHKRSGFIVEKGQLPLSCLKQDKESEGQYRLLKKASLNQPFFTQTLMLDKDDIWDAQALEIYFRSLDVLRAKGVVFSLQGALLINAALGEVSIKQVDRPKESPRLELIDYQAIDLGTIKAQIESLKL